MLCLIDVVYNLHERYVRFRRREIYSYKWNLEIFVDKLYLS